MQSINTTNRRIFAMLNALRSLDDVGGSANIRFQYAVAKNIRSFEQRVKEVRMAGAPNNELAEFENSRIELCEKYAQKDGNGRPRSVKGQFIIEPEKLEEFNNELATLRSCHKPELDRLEARQKAVEAQLDDECGIEYYPIKLSSFPLGAKSSDVEILIDIIDDDMV